MYRYLNIDDTIQATDEWCARHNLDIDRWSSPSMSVGLPYKRYIDFYIFRRRVITPRGNQVIGV